MNSRSSEPMTHCRKASLADGLIGIAATAICLTLARTQFQEQASSWRIMTRTSQSIVIFRFINQLALTWTLCYFPIRLRSPRPPIRELFKQPGMIACSAACLSIAFGALLALPGIVGDLSWMGSQSLTRIVGFSLSNLPIAHAVAGAWLTLWLSGSWRAEPGWIDSMGRTLGAYWVLSLVFLSLQLLWS